MNTLADVLPAQNYYYLLSNGYRYAKHGTEETNGLLVFANLERAEQFMMTVGIGLPEFQPVKVVAEDIVPTIIANGGSMCMTHGLEVMVATLSLNSEEYV